MLYWDRYGSWRPQGGHECGWRDLKLGDLVAVNRAVWRISEVRDVPVADWDEHDRSYFERDREGAERWGTGPVPSEETWDRRPLYLKLYPAKGGKRHSWKVRVYAHLRSAWVLPEHYPVCAECGEPWPCPEIDIVLELQKQAAVMDDLESIMPGCCWGCREPITSRQSSVTFEGENLLLPGAPPPVFHTRRKPGCLGEAMRYEEKWVPAGEGRRWRYRCPGKLIVHADGPECSEDPLCPGPRMRHHAVMDHRHGDYHCLRCQDAAARGEAAAPDGRETRQ
jgi:hypothetical protein